MSRYGLDGGELPELSLPKPKRPAPRPEPETIARSKQHALELGFEDRNGAAAKDERPRRKPGPKPVEPMAKITVTGPARVLDAFCDHCEQQNVPYWKIIEELMKRK